MVTELTAAQTRGIAPNTAKKMLYIQTAATADSGDTIDVTDSDVTGGSTEGIVFTGTPSAGTLMLARNYLCGTWGTSITDVTGGCGNYVMDANGGALINC